MSAYEKLTGKSPAQLLSILQPFGASCFVHDSHPTVQKLDPKAHKAYCVGYDIESESYKVLNPITKMVTCSVNVKFDTTPFTTTLLKVSIKLTRHNTVRTYDKKLKQVDSAKSTNPSSDTNDNNIVAKSSLDNNNFTSSEGSNITSPITFSPTPADYTF